MLLLRWLPAVKKKKPRLLWRLPLPRSLKPPKTPLPLPVQLPLPLLLLPPPRVLPLQQLARPQPLLMQPKTLLVLPPPLLLMLPRSPLAMLPKKLLMPLRLPPRSNSLLHQKKAAFGWLFLWRISIAEFGLDTDPVATGGLIGDANVTGIPPQLACQRRAGEFGAIVLPAQMGGNQVHQSRMVQ